MVHGLMVAGPSLAPVLSQIVGSRSGRAAVEITVNKFYVVSAQANYLARPVPEAPETQIYFINHRSGAFPVLRQRTVVRGERASRSIVNRTTPLWSNWMASSLILAGLGSGLVYVQTRGCGFVVWGGSNGAPNRARCRSGGYDGLSH